MVCPGRVEIDEGGAVRVVERVRQRVRRAGRVHRARYADPRLVLGSRCGSRRSPALHRRHRRCWSVGEQRPSPCSFARCHRQSPRVDRRRHPAPPSLSPWHVTGPSLRPCALQHILQRRRPVDVRVLLHLSFRRHSRALRPCRHHRRHSPPPRLQRRLWPRRPAPRPSRRRRQTHGPTLFFTVTPPHRRPISRPRHCHRRRHMHAPVAPAARRLGRLRPRTPQPLFMRKQRIQVRRDHQRNRRRRSQPRPPNAALAAPAAAVLLPAVVVLRMHIVVGSRSPPRSIVVPRYSSPEQEEIKKRTQICTKSVKGQASSQLKAFHPHRKVNICRKSTYPHFRTSTSVAKLLFFSCQKT
ncbi:hypothetical protein BDN70DRAFT_6125 [Pholiota conissans]|uniref:Uncharacterized protein n=1 Tax=Pholiota conissans TaxID=109636 RepID=A0A9P6D786_9AGAR|nr:hypothetical protein BDN70DRAFT_6125 [Pholiota conissans]